MPHIQTELRIVIFRTLTQLFLSAGSREHVVGSSHGRSAIVDPTGCIRVEV